VSTPEKALAKRIRELRRRHFGPRGKAELARRLDLPLAEYERFERGKLPPGELMVRLCELTGEDLQWLLTGVPARGTVVISGARGRHQNLLTQIAQALDARPTLAAPLEAFLDLLLRSEDARQQTARGLPAPSSDELIPLFEPAEWPEQLPDPDGPGGSELLPATLPGESLAAAEFEHAILVEPTSEYDAGTPSNVTLLVAHDAAGQARRFLRSRTIACYLPGAFGVLLDDETMKPMFSAGDVLVVAAGATPKIGSPALCKFVDCADDRCRIWLGEDADQVHLGRACDGETEHMPRAQLRWSLEVLYRVARAA
jgi:hypothetical protein